MSLMYISEYPEIYKIAGSSLAPEPGFDQAPVTFTATHGESAAFRPDTKLVRVHVDGLANILFGTAPVAVASTNKRMTAGQTEYFALQSTAVGKSFKISAVTST